MAEKKISTLILKKLASGPKCPLCGKPVTVSQGKSCEWVKTKRNEYHFYHDQCIQKLFGDISVLNTINK